MDKEIASILFMPVCTKCLKIIWQRIEGSQRIGLVCGFPRLVGPTYDISPSQCPHCGAWFDNITIPTKLPFEATEHIT